MPNLPLLPRLTHPLGALPAVINHLLAPEPWARAQLSPHAGKTAHIEVAPFSVRLTVTGEGYCALAGSAGTDGAESASEAASEPASQLQGNPTSASSNASLSKPDLRIEVPWSALPSALVSSVQSVAQSSAHASPREAASAALMRQVRLEGDAEFAQAISAVANNLRWDIEDDLSKVVGDVAATRLSGAARKVGGEIRAAQRKLAGNVAEYLLEENPQLVRPRSVDALAEAIRILRDDLARLEKRVDRL